MKKISYLLIAFACLNASAQKNRQMIQSIPFTQIQITDQFWASRMEVNRTVSIPSAFRESEKSGRFDNFALAAGLIQGEHRGDFSFDDTDPYKIIEGASYSLAVKYDARLDAYLDSVIHLISSAQEPDGYLTTCVTNKCSRLSGWWGKARWEKINSHELYNSGHLYEAAVAHFQSTGKRTLLDVAIRNANLVCQVFGPDSGQIHRPSGHPIIEMALSKMYKVTGNPQYLATAKYFIDEAGRGTDGHRLSEYSQDHKPLLQQDEIVGHAVRAGYFYSGVADVAALTGNQDYFKAISRIWENMSGRKLYITGGIGSRADGEGFGPEYELHNDKAYCETCASISNVYWNHRMFLATGDAKYADIVERALYNGVMSGVSLSGDKFFYDNPLESSGQHERQAWFGCACCPGNITRFVASVPAYMYAQRGDEVFVNLYTQSTAKTQVSGQDVKIIQQTSYPWEGNVKIEIQPASSVRFVLKLRIPGWAENTPVPGDLYTFADKNEQAIGLKINGKNVDSERDNGYLILDRKWKKGDHVELNLPMPVRRILANAQVVDDQGKMALQRGPVVYCIEGADQHDNHIFNKYLPLSSDISYSFKKDLLNGVMILKAKAIEIQEDENHQKSEKEVPLMAVPYSTWNNRGAGEMAVWLPYQADKVRQVPPLTTASESE